MTRTIAILATGLSLTFAVATMASSAEAVTPKKYANCTQLNKAYAHGVGKPGAKDKTSGTRVTSFTVNKKVYDLNKGSDRDKDGIACEKK